MKNLATFLRLKHMLEVALKRLAIDPNFCTIVAFTESVGKRTRPAEAKGSKRILA